MAKMGIGRGLDNYIKTLEELDIKTDTLLGKAIYDGAKIVADKVRSNIQSLPVSNSKRRGSVANQIDSITTAQKEGLLQGFGISKLRSDNGVVNGQEKRREKRTSAECRHSTVSRKRNLFQKKASIRSAGSPCYEGRSREGYGGQIRSRDCKNYKVKGAGI